MADLPDLPDFEEEALVATFIIAKPSRVLLKKDSSSGNIVGSVPEDRGSRREVVRKWDS